MSKIEIGEVEVAAEDGRLTFRRRGEPVANIRLDEQGLNELLDFLRSVRIDAHNKRRGFRVPNVDDRIQIQLGGRFASTPARARDVSLSGIFIEFPAEAPELAMGEELEMSIDYGNETAILKGTVMRQTPEGCGVVFEHAASTESPTPPSTFARIVMALERDWLASRLTE